MVKPMPKTRFDRTPQDPLKELVLGRKFALKLTNTKLADKMHMTPMQVRYMLAKPSSDWRIGDAVALTAALDIPIAEMREAIRR